MRKALAICLVAAAPWVWAADKAATAPPPAGTFVTGEVLEIKDVESYTYMRLKTAQGETWAAVPTAKVQKGAQVTIENAMVMNKFESKALKKTFDQVVFGTLATGKGPGAQTAQAQPGAAPAAGPHSLQTKVEGPDAKVPKATGANAYTVAEILAKPAALKDKPVQVRGKVVKYNAGIMGKNWVHLRDGSGSAADQTNDILVTTTEEAKLGDIITAKGVVRTDKDFGMGYQYKALVEEAKLQK